MKVTAASLEKLSAQLDKYANSVEDLDSERPEELAAYHCRCAADELNQAAQELETVELLATMNEEA